jgi:hypothetical protein
MDITNMHDSLLASMEEKLKAFTHAMCGEIQISNKKLQSSLELRIEKRIAPIEMCLDQTTRSITTLETAQRQQASAIEELQRSLNIAAAVIPIKEYVDEGLFARKVDSTLLRINTPDLCTADALRGALASWLADADVTDSAVLTADTPSPSKRFTLQFSGTPGLAENRVRKARALLRLAPGSWRTFPDYVTAAGSSSNRVYVDLDKSPKTIKMERDTKRIRKALETTHPDLQFRTNLFDGSCSCNGMPVARAISIDNNAPCDIHWCHAGVAPNSIDKVATKLSFDIFNTGRSTTSAADVEWSG